MMHNVVYAPEAEAQLVALYFHIAAAASPRDCSQLYRRYREAMRKLEHLPHAGRAAE
jgi:plasmid stabilization system protein ParE